MSISYKIPETEEKFIECVEMFSGLVDAELKRCEAQAASGGIEDLIRLMPALIGLVNSIGYLRGQDGMFLDIRPTTARQGELYENEDSFEKRLQALVDRVMSSEHKDLYMKRLDSYFTRVRSNQSATVI